jgi:hypothetical protein
MKATITKSTLQYSASVARCNFDKTMKSIIDLVVKKNADYGDAWQRYGIFTPLIRINDKILRVKTLSDGRTALIADENIKDTLIDIIGYSMLALEYLRVNKGNSMEAAQLEIFPEDKLGMISTIIDED